MRLIKAILVLTCCLTVEQALARSLPWERELPQAASFASRQAGMSLEEAKAMVQAKYGAQVMRANTVQEDGRTVHYIRLMSADRSRVWTVRVDAATGQEF